MRKAILIILLVPSFAFCAWDRLNRQLETYGDIAQIIMPAAAISYSLYEKDYKGAGYFTEAFACAQGSTLLLKQTNEKRPGKTENRASFPSGHTMSAFTAASFMDIRYNARGKYYFYAAAGLVGISRVAAVKHFIHDVIAGALIGFYSNRILVPRLEKENISLIPYYNGQRFYASASIKF